MIVAALMVASMQAALRSTPDLGQAEGRCRADEAGPAFLVEVAGLKDRRDLLKGKCARCGWLRLCNGNFRARAEAVFGDIWMEDPACYLTEEEIGDAPKGDTPPRSN